SDSPLGPFKPIGKIPLPPGLPSQIDPMLFSDDDGRLYYYWGCTPTDGIYVVELDADNPTRLLGKPPATGMKTRTRDGLRARGCSSGTVRITSRTAPAALRTARTRWVA